MNGQIINSPETGHGNGTHSIRSWWESKTPLRFEREMTGHCQ